MRYFGENKSIRIEVTALLVFSFLALTACTKTETIVQERQAPAQIQSSFAAEDMNHYIKLKKSSLKKAFMLIPSARTSTITPEWNDFRPLIVSFERSGNQLGLFELSSQNIYDEIPSDRLIQTFKVKSEDADTITFDWAYGIKAIPSKEVFDMPGEGPLDSQSVQDGTVEKMEVTDSFVRSVSFDENQMEIEQVSRVKTGLKNVTKALEAAKSGATVETTMSFQFQIRPYVENKKFLESLADDQERVGFFTNTTTKKGNASAQVVRNMKWDLSPERGPITYALTKDIPEEIQQAAAEGVMYWNKVFDREVVKVVRNVDTYMKPQDRTVIVRWINWADAGFAYASIQANPLTGEIVRGQIYLTSAFNNIKTQDKLKASKLKSVAPAGFASAVICQINELTAPENIHGKKVATRMLQDQIRMVVAHESGHTFGLRHNFAGSHTAPMSTRELFAKETEYLKDPSDSAATAQGAPATSSIMDYVNGMDGWLVGAFILNHALPYDQMAIDYGYNGNLYINSHNLEFCTDEYIQVANMAGAKIYGCERFDKKPNPILGESLSASRAINLTIPLRYEALLAKIFQGKEVVTDQELENALSSESYQNFDSTISLYNMASVLLKDESASGGSGNSSKVISIQKARTLLKNLRENQTPLSGAAGNLKTVLTEDMDSDSQSAVCLDLLDSSGMAGVLRMILQMQPGANQQDLSWAQKQVDQLFSSANGDQLSGVVIVNGKEQKYSLTDSQLNRLKSFMLENARAYQKELAVNVGDMFSTSETRKFRTNIGQDRWASDFTELVMNLVLQPEATISTTINGKSVELPKPLLNLMGRLTLMNLIKPAGLNFSGASALKPAMLRKMQAEFVPVLQALGEDVMNITSVQIAQVRNKYSGKIPSEVLDWLMVESSLLTIIENWN